eukprot:s847_g21.t1
MRDDNGPRMLRTRTGQHRWGFPHLKPWEQQQVWSDSQLWLRTLVLARVSKKHSPDMLSMFLQPAGPATYMKHLPEEPPTFTELVDTLEGFLALDKILGCYECVQAAGRDRPRRHIERPEAWVLSLMLQAPLLLGVIMHDNDRVHPQYMLRTNLTVPVLNELPLMEGWAPKGFQPSNPPDELADAELWDDDVNPFKGGQPTKTTAEGSGQAQGYCQFTWPGCNDALVWQGTSCANSWIPW